MKTIRYLYKCRLCGATTDKIIKLPEKVPLKDVVEGNASVIGAHECKKNVCGAADFIGAKVEDE